MQDTRQGQLSVTLSHLQKLAPSILKVLAQVLVAEYALGFAIWYALADGLKDLSGTPLGADFLNVYAAGLMVWRGQAAVAYDWVAHRQIEQSVVGYAAPYFAWHYPPMFLAVAALVALLPYLWAFGLYLAAGLGGYWAVVRRIAPRTKETLWMLAAFPGVFANIINGQNGFITTALFGAGLLTLEERPWLAGAMFGLLAYKPQFFVVIPLILAVGGYGRAVLATFISALAGAALSWAVFGTVAWQAFFNSAALTQHIILEQGVTGWKKIQSVFSMVRMWGGDVPTAYMVQGLVALAALASAAWVWRRHATLATRAAALCAAILLMTPYVLDYDLVILAVPLAFLARQGMETGFRPYEKIILAGLWILPLVARLWGGHSIPLTPPLMMALMGLCLARVQRT
jgi:hypothetical protein